MPLTLCLTVRTLEHLDSLAAWLAEALRPGDIVALNGPMGAGKTTLIQALGRHLDITEKIVSPTFTLLNEYTSGRIPLVHTDFYRLGPEGAEGVEADLFSALDELGSDKLAPILVAEWAEYAEFLAPHLTLSLTLELCPDDTRLIHLVFQTEREMKAPPPHLHLPDTN